MFTDMVVQTGMHTEATVIQAEAEKELKLKQSHFSLPASTYTEKISTKSRDQRCYIAYYRWRN